MRTFLTRFFVTLGVVFFLLLCAGAYVWFADPFGVRPLVAFLRSTPAPSASSVATHVPNVSPATTTTSIPGEVAKVEEHASVKTGDAHPALTPAQEQALQSVGIDPTSLPASITPSQEACFTEKLGASRIAEIKAGGVPTAAELFTARTCLK